MKSSKYYRSLKHIVAQTLEETIAQIIIQVDKKYVLFNRYSITSNDGFFTVFRRSDAENFEFTYIKYAFAWVILDKHNKYTERDRLHTLDQDLTSVKVSQQIHKRLLTKYRQNDSLRAIYSMKLQLDRDKEKRIVAECDKYITMANKCHLQGIKK